jgi:TonB family protein
VRLGQTVSIREPIAAVADHEGRIYLLGECGASVIECDEQGNPRFIFNYALPPAFNPGMIGIAGEQAYLVDPAGKVAFYPLDRKTTPAEVLDASPQILTDLEPLREAVRKAGYTGRIEIHVGVSAEGTPEHPRIQSPTFLANDSEVMETIEAWRFRPAIRAGNPAAVPMELNLDVF